MNGKLITAFEIVPYSSDLALMAYVVLTLCLYALHSFQSLLNTKKNKTSSEEAHVSHMRK